MKRVFIGSSSEALSAANQIAALISSDGTVAVDLWTEIFPSGLVTIEAIEREARRCSGALFIASPDDSAMIRGRPVRVPRTNVMLEYGYFIALLGRTRVALCPYTNVELPTDLHGLTSIHLGESAAPSHDPPQASLPLSESIQQRIWTWIGTLEHVVPGRRQIEVRHGYSGRWEVRSIFDLWRGQKIGKDEFAQLDGFMDLDLERDGTPGKGVLHGEFCVRLRQRHQCDVQYRVCDRIHDVTCDLEGRLKLTTDYFNRQHAGDEVELPRRDGFEHNKRGPNRVRWILQPDGTMTTPTSDEVKLSGSYISYQGNRMRSRSRVTAWRVA